MKSRLRKQEKRWPKWRVYLLSRCVVIAVLLLSLGTFFWTPQGAFQWTADIVFRVWMMFLGTVMAHECTHGLLGRTKKANFWWGA